ncbi:MAG: ATP-binding cassette domain-containing protein [Spirochaetes bacterium]|nr:ATP-binding cassette domain-containing protein [Spirochaetota bacterium]
MLTFDNVVGLAHECLFDEHFPVSFDLRPGEIGIIRGGFKASSLIRIAAIRGILIRGSITLLGNTIESGDNPARYLSPHFTKKFRPSIGFCHQNGGLLANMTIVQNVMLPAHYHSGHRSPEPFYALARERLQEADVPEEYWGLRPSDVPPEYQKRALFARSIIHEPKILILDEPTAGIPWEQTHEIASWLLGQKGMGRGILIATDNDPFAALVGDWLVDLDRSAYKSCNNEIRLFLGDIVDKSSALIKKQMKAGKKNAQ